MGSDSSLCIARLCRSYVSFLENPGTDALFYWLGALHSVKDRVPGPMSEELFGLGEFIALIQLRNLFHHQAEVASRVRALSIDGFDLVSDLGILCLVDRPVVEMALDGIGSKFRDIQRPLAESALKWYGSCVNIYPAMFNLMVGIVLLSGRFELSPNEQAFDRLAGAIEHDRQSGYPITVSGDIGCRAGDVDQVLARLMEM